VIKLSSWEQWKSQLHTSSFLLDDKKISFLKSLETFYLSLNAYFFFAEYNFAITG
jgi:hypothetical protein